MGEIGSEFWSVPVTSKKNEIFPERAQWFISGRGALQSVLSELKDIRTVAMPSWCCDTMIRPFKDAGIEVSFYPVYFRERIRKELSFESDALLLMDYFGYSDSSPDIIGYKGTVIRDVTHSVFTSQPTDAGYYFGSLRKWCGVWTGGYAWTADGHPLKDADPEDVYYSSLRKEAMALKERYINGDKAVGKEYLGIFGKAEDYLDIAGMTAASGRDEEAAIYLDTDFMKSRRRANACVLMENLADLLIFPELKEDDCPLFVPVMIPEGKRDELRMFLIEREIYCPVHWPVTDVHNLTDKEKELYDGELSLVCDQRYSEEDMERIAETVKLFWRK